MKSLQMVLIPLIALVAAVASKRGLFARVGLAAALAVTLLWMGGHGAQAATFNPTVVVTLSDDMAGANADVTYEFNVPGGDANEEVNIFFIPVEFTRGTDIPIGAHVANLDALTTLGLLNDPCQTGLPVSFEMYNASLDTSDTVIFEDSYIDADANTLPDGVEKYPDFLNTLLPGLTPTSRIFGTTSVGGTAVTMNVVFFEPGATLYGIEFDAALGTPSESVLNDPAAALAPNPITDFCTPLSVTTTRFGMSKDNTNTAADESGAVVSTNPTTAGDYIFNNYVKGIPDADGDGSDNGMDTCPFQTDTGADGDNDGLDDVCDPDPAVASAGLDEDGDGYMNRGDNCPLVANGAADADNQGDSDFDGIGDACDPNPDDADSEGEAPEALLSQDVTITEAVATPAVETPTPTVAPPATPVATPTPVIAPPPTGAGSASDSSWAWWPFAAAVAGAAAAAVGVLLVYRARSAKP